MSSTLALLLQVLELAGTLILLTAAGILLWVALSPFAYALLRVGEALHEIGHGGAEEQDEVERDDRQE